MHTITEAIDFHRARRYWCMESARSFAKSYADWGSNFAAKSRDNAVSDARAANRRLISVKRAEKFLLHPSTLKVFAEWKS